MHATKRTQFSGGARRKDRCRRVRRRCSCRIFQRMSPQEKSPCKLTMLKWRSDSVKCWKHVFRKRRLFHPNERRAAYRLGARCWRKGICHRRWPAARGSGADGPCRNAVSASAIPREPRHTRQPCISPGRKPAPRRRWSARRCNSRSARCRRRRRRSASGSTGAAPCRRESALSAASPARTTAWRLRREPRM